MFGKSRTPKQEGSFLFSFINGWAARSSGRGSSSSQFTKATSGASRGKL